MLHSALAVVFLLFAQTNSGWSLGGDDTRRRGDPAYRQEYVQVRDAGLSAVVCQQHVHSRGTSGQTQCAHVLNALAALKGLGFTTVQVFDCTKLHHTLHHSNSAPVMPARNGTSLVCSGVKYEDPHDIKPLEKADVFLMVGDSFVPSITEMHHSGHAGAHSSTHGMLSQTALAQQRITRIYMHTGTSHHMQVLAREKRGMSGRESRLAIRNIGLYDNILFFDESDMKIYSELMNPLFSTLSPASGHTGMPTLLPIPPRLTALSVNHTFALQQQQKREMQQRLEQAIVDTILGSPFLYFIRTRLNFLRSTVVLDRPRQFESFFFGEGKGGFGGDGGGGGVSNSKSHTETLVAMIIEPRIEGSFEFCVRNVLSHLGDAWVLHVHHSKSNEHFVRHVLHDLAADRVKYVLLPEPFADSGDYNQYLKSASLWTKLHSNHVKHVLIFQSDSFMVETNPPQKISQYLKYSFIGAPWHLTAGAESADWLRAMQRKKLLISGVGNGGFSLRNVSSMLLVATNHRSKNPQINEDVFFQQYLPQYQSLGVGLPTRQEAYRFAREVPCDDLVDSGTPLAFHSAWVYVNKSQAHEYFQSSFVPV